MWLLGHVAMGVCGDISDTAASSQTASAVTIAIGVLGKCVRDLRGLMSRECVEVWDVLLLLRFPA